MGVMLSTSMMLVVVIACGGDDESNHCFEDVLSSVVC